MAIQLPLSGLVLPVPVLPSSHPDRADLWDWPDVDAATLCAQACLLGAAGEALVDSVLLRYGLVPLPVPPGMAADRLVVHPDRLLRMQIKSTSSRREDGYAVNVVRGYRGSPQGRRAYDADDYDILAIAVLPEMVVHFTTECRGRHRVPWGEIAALRARPRDTLETALVALGLDPGAAGRRRNALEPAADGPAARHPHAPAAGAAADTADISDTDLLPPCAA